MEKPRRIFRARKGSRDLHVGMAPLAAFRVWTEQNRGRFKPGTVTNVQVWHDHDCRYPQGGPCTCRNGPEIRVEGEDPETN